jgi:hypothetical protein
MDRDSGVRPGEAERALRTQQSVEVRDERRVIYGRNSTVVWSRDTELATGTQLHT